MARESTVICPSGLQVRFRSVKGKDLDALRDKRKQQTGEAVNDLLDVCTLAVIDDPLYGMKTFTWLDTLIGDQVTAFIALRSATIGQTFDFDLKCKDRECRQRIEWTLQLDKLQNKALPPESAANFKSGNEFFTTVDGRQVKFKLRTGRDQVRLAKTIQNIQMAAPKKDRNREQVKTLLGVGARITQVEGVDDVMPWLDDLDLHDITVLVRNMDAVDCGVETTIDVVCNGPEGCGLQQAVELPLDNKFFNMAI